MAVDDAHAILVFRFAATIQATEEAIVNALVAAETMVGVDGRRVQALPQAWVSDIPERFGRLATPPNIDNSA